MLPVLRNVKGGARYVVEDAWPALPFHAGHTSSWERKRCGLCDGRFAVLDLRPRTVDLLLLDYPTMAAGKVPPALSVSGTRCCPAFVL